MATQHAPYHPIIYVRGFAMSQSEIDQTTADPFCGFNLGSTVFRAVPDKKRPPRKYIFESPVVRLVTDLQYSDVDEDGYDIVDPDWVAKGTNLLRYRSIVIFRYYDEASNLLGNGKTPTIEEFACKLGDLILQIRDLACANPENGVAPEDFRCHLVAHSMGGLVCRAFLQNPKLGTQEARALVDKLFTYATPHNGIDAAGVNVPSWFTKSDLDNFNRSRMAKYLDLEVAYKKTGRVDWIPEDRFPEKRVFTMVGTNRLDYEAAFGAARTFVGHGSDGLVRIENASVQELKADGSEGRPAAKAFCYRSHSGYFGIVNSEEAYQNLIRFLFGDVRVDVWADVWDIRLPTALQQKEAAGKKINALYQFEVMASPRGKLWYLTRRTAEEDSVACLTHQEWRTDPVKEGSLYLSSVFLANRAKVVPSRPTLAYSFYLGVRVPDYEVDNSLWIDEHYEGSYLFRNTIVVEITPPAQAGGQWFVSYDWQDEGCTLPATPIDAQALATGAVAVRIPFGNDANPGIKGEIRFVISGWNQG